MAPMLALASLIVAFISGKIVHGVPVSAEYSRLCDSTFCRIIEKSNVEISQLKSMVDEGSTIPQFGQRADQICNMALEMFATDAPLPDDDKENEALYDRKIEELEKLIDSPLHVLYLRQLALSRERALRVFKQSNKGDGSEFEALLQADELFKREAEDFTRQNPEWSYAKDASILKSSLLEVAQRTKKLNEEKLRASKAQQNIMSIIGQYQQQLQAMQQQISGGGSPWNCGVAYRVPDTNFNLQLSYQQGRANVQISCVPDESMSLLGANGFVNGVTPGNVGLSFNINV